MGKILLIDALGHGCNTAGMYLGNDTVYLPYGDGTSNTYKVHRGKINREYAKCLREVLTEMLSNYDYHVLSILDIHKDYFESSLKDKIRSVGKIWLHNDPLTVVFDSCVTESPKNVGLSIDGAFNDYLPLYVRLRDSLTPENYRGSSYVEKGHRNLSDNLTVTMKLYVERKTVVVVTGNLNNLSDFKRLSDSSEIKKVCTELALAIFKKFNL